MPGDTRRRYPSELKARAVRRYAEFRPCMRGLSSRTLCGPTGQRAPGLRHGMLVQCSR